jgi:hypothetical protein
MMTRNIKRRTLVAALGVSALLYGIAGTQAQEQKTFALAHSGPWHTADITDSKF